MQSASLLDLGTARYHQGDLAAAGAIFRDIIAAEPENADALSNLAGVLNAAQCEIEAEAASRAALAAQPGHWAALANLGCALHRQNRLTEAADAYIRAVNASEANAGAWSNLGVVLASQGRFDGAMIAHNAAIKHAPDDAELRTNRAIALLAAGHYREGFAEYEWRWRCAGMKPHGMTAPLWLGKPCTATTLLVIEEGGFGDTLQFLRFIKPLAGRFARIIVRVQPALVRLVRRALCPFAEVIGEHDPLPPHDLFCPMMSLPHALGTEIATLPPPFALVPRDPNPWHARLNAQFGADGLRAGLVWAGAPRLGMAQARAMNARRSIPPELLLPLAEIPGLHLVSLQLAAEPPPFALFDPMAEMRDFADTADLVAALDIVITVDSALAHLAASLGRPVWLLDRYDNCWRWLSGRRDSPWYPGLRIFRQLEPGDWGDVIQEVRKEGLLFLEKKKQKNFAIWHPRVSAAWPNG